MHRINDISAEKNIQVTFIKKDVFNNWLLKLSNKLVALSRKITLLHLHMKNLRHTAAVNKTDTSNNSFMDSHSMYNCTLRSDDICKLPILKYVSLTLTPENNPWIRHYIQPFHINSYITKSKLYSELKTS